MRSLFIVCVLVTAAVTPAAGTAARPAEAAGDGPTSSATIERVYPNPVTAGDRGEFVVLAVPPETTLSGCTLTDGEGRLRLSNASARRIAVATDESAANSTDLPVRTPPGEIALSNGGEKLTLVCSGTVVDTFRYGDAPEGEIAVRTGDRIEWRPLGATDFPVVRAGPDEVRAFVLPDAPGPPLAPIRDADRRVLLAGYTLTSGRVAEALVRARERGATVRVLLDGDPIGGLTRRQARIADRLVAAGIEVRVLSGPRDRYAYHHAKYVVADDRAVVLT
ncbi:MAG: phospholipase D-like domain-containing protein, partial [Haloarculaceae archaeon]